MYINDISDGGDVVWRDKTESSREGQNDANSLHDEEAQSEKIEPGECTYK